MRPELKLFRGDDLYYAGLLLLAVCVCIVFVVRVIRFISERDAFDDEQSQKTIRQVWFKQKDFCDSYLNTNIAGEVIDFHYIIVGAFYVKALTAYFPANYMNISKLLL